MSLGEGRLHGEARLPVLIVGGGVSGLATLAALNRGGRPALLLEASSRLGGNIRTEEHDGFLYDVGPDSFLKTKPDGQRLCEETGLGAELISPSPDGSRVFVALDGVLHPMPEGLALGVPTRPTSLLDSPLLSPEGKLRAFCEPFIPPRKELTEESIFDFTRRRLGVEMAERIAAPLLSGVFAGDATRLSLPATFPQLAALEQKYGSLFSGMNGGKGVLAVLTQGRREPANPFLSLKRGLGSLIQALTDEAQPGQVRLACAVRRVLPPRAGEPAGVLLADGSRLPGSHVVLAGPPWVAAQLLGDFPSSAALAQVRGCPTATVFFGLREAEVSSDLRGSGFIVPPGEGDILASTWISSKWVGRASPSTALVRAFVGGARREELLSRSDADLLDLAQRELTRLMGPLGRPLFRRVFRYERGTPQPELGHQDRMARLEQDLAGHPWLSVIGSGYGGVGIPDCARQAREVAEGLLKGDPPRGESAHS